jgi:CRP-like cAMP-binding protein
METGFLGKLYRDGEVIIREGEPGDCMFVVQAGEVEVVQHQEGQEVLLGVLAEEDIFGEMSLFTGEPRSATVRALGECRVLTIEKRSFLRRVHEDPSLAFRLMQRLCFRIKELDAELMARKVEDTAALGLSSRAG